MAGQMAELIAADVIIVIHAGVELTMILID